MQFRGLVELGGTTATGIEVPEAVILELGDSKRAAVVVSVAGYSYRTTATRMHGRFMVPLSAEHRTAAGLAVGDEVQVDIVIDDAPREVELPADLDQALDKVTRAHFQALAFTHRKEWARWIQEAKRPTTRTARIEKTVTAMREGRSTFP